MLLFYVQMNIFTKKKKTLLEFWYFVEAGKLWDGGVLESQGH